MTHFDDGVDDVDDDVDISIFDHKGPDVTYRECAECGDTICCPCCDKPIEFLVSVSPANALCNACSPDEFERVAARQ
jgi:hypothetical protein